MQCGICANKKATVHLTEIVDEQISELHLCEDCAREKSVQMEQQFGLADLLAGLADFSKQTKDVDKVKAKCVNCGLSYDDFRKFGRLGCSECYQSFRESLGALLKKIHGSNQHLGKAPIKLPAADKQKIDSLQRPKGFSCRPVLIHVNGVSDAVIDQEYFVNIIDIAQFLD